MLDPLTSETEKTATIRRPYNACTKCLWFRQRSEMSDTSEGLVDICNLEPICRNAVHIAWMSLTEEEKEERTAMETLPLPEDKDFVRCGDCEYFDELGNGMTKCRKHVVYGVFHKSDYCSYGRRKEKDTSEAMQNGE